MISSASSGAEVGLALDKNVNTFKRKELMRANDSEPEASITYLHGFFQAKAELTALDLDALSTQSNAFVDRSPDNPSEEAPKALEAVTRRCGLRPVAPGAVKLAAVIVPTGALAISVRQAPAEARSRLFCQDYAHYVARRNSRGAIVGDAARGAIGGAMVCGIANGSRGAHRGARIGGAVGTIAGGVRRAVAYDVFCDGACYRCIRR
jgi:hypothetical protein